MVHGNVGPPKQGRESGWGVKKKQRYRFIVVENEKKKQKGLNEGRPRKRRTASPKKGEGLIMEGLIMELTEGEAKKGCSRQDKSQNEFQTEGRMDG